MSLTKIDCAAFRGEDASSEKASYRLFSPANTPGTALGVFAQSGEDRVSSKVAAQLALTHFVERAIDPFFDPKSLTPPAGADQLAFDFDSPGDFNSAVLQAALAEVNRAVYEFGHQVGAGGDMTAELLSFVLRNGKLSGARVGSGALYLFRRNEIFDFFDRSDHALGSKLVGSSQKIDAEFSSIPLEPHDMIVALPQLLGSFGMEQLRIALRDRPKSALSVAKKLYSELGSIPWVVLLETGPHAIYLSDKSEVTEQVQEC